MNENASGLLPFESPDDENRLSFIKTPFGPGLPVGNPRDAR